MDFNSKNVLTFSEGCTYCGIAPSYMYKLTSQRKIGHFKPQGKLIFFERTELENWLKRNRVKTAEEIETDAVNYVTVGKNRVGGGIKKP